MLEPTRPRDLGALTGIAVGISFLGGVGGAMALANAPFPRPGATAADIRHYFESSTSAARLSAAGQLVSALALARFTISAAQLARRSGPGSRALTTATLAGGGLAVASLAVAGGTHASLTGPAKDNDETALARSRRVFVAGGPIHGIGFGLLTAALALAGRRTGELSRAATVTGMVSAVSSLLSPLYFLWEPAGWLIPGGRFPGLVISGIAGARLAQRRTTSPVTRPRPTGP